MAPQAQEPLRTMGREGFSSIVFTSLRLFSVQCSHMKALIDVIEISGAKCLIKVNIVRYTDSDEANKAQGWKWVVSSA